MGKRSGDDDGASVYHHRDLAFVFGVTVSNTITKRQNVIGTLRASGYTKGELILHYMTMPLAVTWSEH